MTFEEIKQIDLFRKQILIIGRAGSGKSWLSKQLDPFDLDILHTDEYLPLRETRGVQALIEDSPLGWGKPFRIIEGMIGYMLLLTGFQEQSYRPDIIINCEISAGKQREIYLRERSADSLKYQHHFYGKCLATLNEYYRLCPENERPPIYEFSNNWNYATEVKDK